MKLQLPDSLDPQFETKAVVAIAPYLARRFSNLNRRIQAHLESTGACAEGVGWGEFNEEPADQVAYHILVGGLLAMVIAMLSEWEGDPTHPSYPHDLTTPMDKGADILNYLPIRNRPELRSKFEHLLLHMGLPPVAPISEGQL